MLTKSEVVREIRAVQAEDEKKPTRLGAWVWVLLLGTSLAYELFAFADGSGGEPTLSQLVKGIRRATGVVGSIALSFGLFGAFVVLLMHWVLEIF